MASSVAQDHFDAARLAFNDARGTASAKALLTSTCKLLLSLGPVSRRPEPSSDTALPHTLPAVWTALHDALQCLGPHARALTLKTGRKVLEEVAFGVRHVVQRQAWHTLGAIATALHTLLVPATAVTTPTTAAAPTGGSGSDDDDGDDGRGQTPASAHRAHLCVPFDEACGAVGSAVQAAVATPPARDFIAAVLGVVLRLVPLQPGPRKTFDVAVRHLLQPVMQVVAATPGSTARSDAAATAATDVLFHAVFSSDVVGTLPHAFSRSLDVVAAAVGCPASASKPKRAPFQRALFEALAHLPPAALRGAPALLSVFHRRCVDVEPSAPATPLPPVNPEFGMLLELLAVVLPSVATPSAAACRDADRLRVAEGLLATASRLAVYVPSDDVAPHPRFESLLAVARVAGVPSAPGTVPPSPVDVFEAQCRVSQAALQLDHRLVCDHLQHVVRAVVQQVEGDAACAPAADALLAAVVATYARLRQVGVLMAAAARAMGVSAADGVAVPTAAAAGASVAALLARRRCMADVSAALHTAPARQLPRLWDEQLAAVAACFAVGPDDASAVAPLVAVLVSWLELVSRHVAVTDVNAVSWHRKCAALLADVAHPVVAAHASSPPVFVAAAVRLAAAAAELALVCGRFVHLHLQPLPKLADFVLVPSGTAGAVPPLPVPLPVLARCVDAAAPALAASAAADTRLAFLRCVGQRLGAVRRAVRDAAAAVAAGGDGGDQDAAALTRMLLQPFPAPGVPPAAHVAVIARHLPHLMPHAPAKALQPVAEWVALHASDHPVARAIVHDAQLLEMPALCSAVVTAAVGTALSGAAAVCAGWGSAPLAAVASGGRGAVPALCEVLEAGGAVAAKHIPASHAATFASAATLLAVLASMPAGVLPPPAVPACVAACVAWEAVCTAREAAQKRRRRRSTAGVHHGGGEDATPSGVPADMKARVRAAARDALVVACAAAPTAVAPCVVVGPVTARMWLAPAATLSSATASALHASALALATAVASSAMHCPGVYKHLTALFQAASPPLPVATAVIEALAAAFPATDTKAPKPVRRLVAHLATAATAPTGFHAAHLAAAITLLVRARPLVAPAASATAALPSAVDVVAALAASLQPRQPAPPAAAVCRGLSSVLHMCRAEPSNATFFPVTALVSSVAVDATCAAAPGRDPHTPRLSCATVAVAPAVSLLRTHLATATGEQAAALFDAVHRQSALFAAVSSPTAGAWVSALCTATVLQQLLHGLQAVGRGAAVGHSVTNRGVPVVCGCTPMVRAAAARRHDPVAAAVSAAVLDGAAVLVARAHAFRFTSNQFGEALEVVAAALPPAPAPPPPPAVLKAACTVLYAAARHRRKCVADTLPMFVRTVAMVLRAAFRTADAGPAGDYAHVGYVARIVDELVLSPDMFRRYSAYLLCDYVRCSVGGGPHQPGAHRPAPQAVRDLLQPALHGLFALASSHELQLVHAALQASPAGRTLFKAEHRHYEAHVEYKGKV